MEEVAALARVSKGTLYRYFESKEQLLLNTMIDSYERFLPLVEEESREGSDPRQRLDAMLDGMTKLLAAVAPRMSVHYQAWGIVAKKRELEGRLFGFLRRFHVERGAEIQRTIREGQRRGVFRPDADVEAFEAGIQALLSGFLYRATFHAEQATPAALSRTFDALVRDVLLLEDAPDGGSAGD
jgi:AcrR family transcriptional regulator